ncbi:MAG: trypsin-like peptidase domain-containing protein [Piscinibacter sp.]|nr:trypsin-like peptidase domain-containing protein [Piscinibacter sp.]
MSRRVAAAIGLALALIVAPAAAAPAPVPTLAQAFKQVGPAVVVVRTRERVAPAAGGPGAAPASVAGLGSGVLISADGQVLTAAHVVQAADAVAVEFPGGAAVRARVVASDQAADVALLQLERVPPGIVPARLGDSDRAEVGDEVFIVGAPLGISHTLTVGHLSARRRSTSGFGALFPAELFQTDAAINRGNSGGPMFNRAGEVIGVVSHIVSTSGGSEGLGFVVTSNLARRLLLDEPTPWSGLDGYLVTPELARLLNLPAAGLLVQRVAAGSPAEQLGLRGGQVPATIAEESLLLGGDLVLAVEGLSFALPDAGERIRHRLVAWRGSGAALHLQVLREGRLFELEARVRR